MELFSAFESIPIYRSHRNSSSEFLHGYCTDETNPYIVETEMSAALFLLKYLTSTYQSYEFLAVAGLSLTMPQAEECKDNLRRKFGKR